MSGPLPPFPERYRHALANDQLRQNLLKFQRFYRASRAAAFDRYAREGGATGVADPTFAGQRERLASAKSEAVGERRRYLQQFTEQATTAGATVYVAATAEDATRYVVDLCQRRGARLLAKSKSMLSEEVFLNHALEAAGVRAVETDLGEWIIQLAHETPSHMVVPAVHKNRREISEIIEAEVGYPVSREDIPDMTTAARLALRSVFASADVGMSGANALIAETGTVMLVTNEGNARLVTSLPPVHVVLAGWEKLVPTFEDAAAQVRLLARCGTTQDITVYTTFITGPDRPDREQHIVIVDNGRSAMADDPRFADALRCIRCAACADVCPPYQVVGGHVFGYVYSGAIGLVNTPFHHGLDAGAGPQSLCVSCNACAVACPVGIPLPRQILDVRRMVVEQKGMPLPNRTVLRLWERPRLFDALLRLASIIQAPLVRRNDGRSPVPHRDDRQIQGADDDRAAVVGDDRTRAGTRGPGFLRLPLPERLRWRSIPALARRPARDHLLGRTFEPFPAGPLAASPARGMTVAYFIQCITDRFAPEQAAASVRVLRACGARVVVPSPQHCCGLPAFDSGDHPSAVKLAKMTIEALERVSADYIVTAAASCAITINHEYVDLLRDEPAWQQRAARLAARSLDLVTFLDRVVRPADGALAGSGPAASLTYHSFCQSTNVLHIRETSVRLLRDVCGLDVRDLPEGEVCCGFGGATSIDHPLVARGIVGRKLDNVASTDAPLLVTDNPGCLLHLRGAADARGMNLRVAHIAEVLAERL
ncbi:MAG: LUD domain-containing protein [Chloroflexi bacterium]|nr:LUD domain-containing protein [Chloroflexota bacterium]